jgi:hypothetical protein
MAAPRVQTADQPAESYNQADAVEPTAPPRKYTVR